MNSLPICPEWLPHPYIGGTDEVGLGSLAGPVVSALVILPRDFECDLINDSKKLTDKKRRAVYDFILENALAYSVQAVSVNWINKHGIHPATMRSMHKCIDDISLKPNYLLVDGDKWDGYQQIPYETVVKGDSTYLSIAAASIIAKVQRDDYMIKLNELFPGYGWDSNKGYGSKAHLTGLKRLGPTQYHRTQFVRNHI